MKYAYFPGCSLHSTAKEYDSSTQAVCRVLGLELDEIPDWNCCGASSAHSLNHDLGIALPLRNLAKAEATGLDVVAPCAACFNRMKSADAALKSDPDLLRTLTGKIGVEYRGSINVISLLQAVHSLGTEQIAKNVKTGLSGLKVACYYGCLLLRPPATIGFDDPENPTSMDQIVTALGAEAIDWPYKHECCGAGLSISRSDVVVKLTHDILSMAKRAGANCLVTACPLCQTNLDSRQSQVESAYNEQYGMPVFYLTQLMGIAFGLSKGSLGLNKHMVDPMPVLAGVGSKG
jgi:heterodisulfide reductase subunit B